MGEPRLNQAGKRLSERRETEAEAEESPVVPRPLPPPASAGFSIS